MQESTVLYQKFHDQTTNDSRENVPRGFATALSFEEQADLGE
jgi:hypothetical protein